MIGSKTRLENRHEKTKQKKETTDDYVLLSDFNQNMAIHYENLATSSIYYRVVFLKW